MSIKNILLHLDPAGGNEAETDTAVMLALAHDAHLAALATVTDPELPIYGFAGLSEGIYRALEKGVAEEVQRVRAAFEKRLARDGIGVDFRAAKVYGGEVHEIVAIHGRHSDLVVVRQSSPDVPRAGGREVVEEIVLGVGRPVLVTPYTGARSSVGRRVVMGWDGSREAARALGDALPLMKKAESVHVLVVNPSDRRLSHGDMPGADISTHLARHGLAVDLVIEKADGIDPADLILSRAADMDADLLVMGAFGHSRLQETLFGGVSRSILRQMTLPVLLSH